MDNGKLSNSDLYAKLPKDLCLSPAVFKEPKHMDCFLGHMCAVIGLSYSEIIDGMSEDIDLHPWMLCAYPTPTSDDVTQLWRNIT